MPTIKEAVSQNQQRIANGGETGTGVGTSAPPIAPTPPQDLPSGLPQRGMFPASLTLNSDRSDSNRAYRGAGARSSTFPYSTQPAIVSKTTVVEAAAPSSGSGGGGGGSVSLEAGPGIAVSGDTISGQVGSIVVPSFLSVGGALPVTAFPDAGPIVIRAGAPVPVANGGTGTATPGLVAGSNISVTGPWPDQNIAFSGILPVANGGSGSSGPSLIAGSNITISGSWPNQTIAASGGASSPAITQFNNYNLASDVTILSSFTQVFSETITMPSSGGPWRVMISYSLCLHFTHSEQDVVFYVFDGTNYHAVTQTGPSNASSGADTSATYGGFTTTTYTNSANVNFILYGQVALSSGSCVVKQLTFIGGTIPGSTLQLAVMPSN